MKHKPLPIGVEDFKRLVDNGYYFVDKTLMIKELLENKETVNLFTRPRRFGKTLNMSMLQRFFEATEKSNAYLFDGLKIAAYPEYMAYQGQYPVISISLKSMKQASYTDAFYMYKNLIAKEYEKHKIILESNKILDSEKEVFQNIMEQRADQNVYLNSIRTLSDILAKYYEKNVIILIDEYDVPLENAYHEGFYDDMTNLIRSCFESALKTNPSLEFAVLTGCLRVSRESIFTGLNNLKTYSITKNKFSQYFGFTQAEMQEILQTFSLEQYAGTIAKWYDGYRFGLTEIYNPWSVLNCIDSYLQNDMVACEPYWSNTSSNRIVKRLIEESNERTKSMVEELINGTPIHTQIFEDVTYGTIDVNQDYIWSFLLFTGYLKIISCETVGDETYYDMVIPNVEIKSIYKNTIRSWFIDHVNRDSRTDILESVIHADAEKLEDLLCTWLTNTISCFDEQENYYHGFVTGLVSGFSGYMVVSNRESGNGRFDLVVKQRSRWHHAAILEFKVVEKYNQMTKACEDALRQIEEKDYEASLRDEQYENIAKLGICFCQKRCRVKSGGVDHFEY
ncbi:MULTISPECIES: AAA family ATPase [Ruminococcus]|uniref:AAA family ATPase n=1 Tax=Ruminococcus TaxID=1263 RepID=UPI000E43F277|nr:MULTISPECIES: AAA family ATPase [Ruminococcus]MBS6597485.1 AAA family ATPase [Ruminococcus callidus]RGM76723.1 AAA family ATPase [Ruminococcus sp. OM06-36AC]